MTKAGDKNLIGNAWGLFLVSKVILPPCGHLGHSDLHPRFENRSTSHLSGFPALSEGDLQSFSPLLVQGRTTLLPVGRNQGCMTQLYRQRAVLAQSFLKHHFPWPQAFHPALHSCFRIFFLIINRKGTKNYPYSHHFLCELIKYTPLIHPTSQVSNLAFHLYPS